MEHQDLFSIVLSLILFRIGMYNYREYI